MQTAFSRVRPFSLSSPFDAPRPWAPAGFGRARSMGQAQAAAPPTMTDDARWYQRAKDAVAEYDSLVIRAARLANRPIRESVLARYAGDPADTAGARYRRDSVADDIRFAESFAPVNFLVFAEPRRRNRVDELRDWNRAFRDEVTAAETTYGVLPEPVMVPVPGPVVTRAPTWLTPVLVGGGAIGLAALLGLI